MGENVVADFIGRFHSPDVSGSEPVTGRILLSQKRLVLASDGVKTTIPLSAVSDVNVGTVPPALLKFFSDTISIAYTIDDSRGVSVIESDGENVGKFTTIFFKTILHNLTVLVTHPAKKGGRVTDALDRKMKLKLSKGELRLVGSGENFSIDLSSVVGFGHETRTFNGSKHPSLTVDHAPDATTLTTAITLPNTRKLNLLGRYLRLEYSDVMESISELDLTEEQLEILVGLYSAGGTAPLKHLITGDAAQMTMILDDLRDEDLVADHEDSMRLTPRGRVVVSNQIEDVNM